MAQGAVKKARARPKPAVAKRQARRTSVQTAKAVKPKRDKARVAAEAVRQHLSTLTRTTETNTAAKARHLDVLKAGAEKKAKKAKAKPKKAAQE